MWVVRVGLVVSTALAVEDHHVHVRQVIKDERIAANTPVTSFVEQSVLPALTDPPPGDDIAQDPELEKNVHQQIDDGHYTALYNTCEKSLPMFRAALDYLSTKAKTMHKFDTKHLSDLSTNFLNKFEGHDFLMQAKEQFHELKQRVDQAVTMNMRGADVRRNRNQKEKIVTDAVNFPRQYLSTFLEFLADYPNLLQWAAGILQKKFKEAVEEWHTKNLAGVAIVLKAIEKHPALGGEFMKSSDLQNLRKEAIAALVKDSSGFKYHVMFSPEAPQMLEELQSEVKNQKEKLPDEEIINTAVQGGAPLKADGPVEE